MTIGLTASIGLEKNIAYWKCVEKKLFALVIDSTVKIINWDILVYLLKLYL